MGIAFAISERDPSARLAHNSSHNFKRSIQYVRKSHGTVAMLEFAWANWELYLSPWQQLIIWYIVLLLLTGVGAVIFNQCEYDTEATSLIDKRNFKDRVTETFEHDAIKWDLVKEWANLASEFMDVNLWGFRYAVFFAATTFCTIGFGIQAPRTEVGRAMVFFYGFPAIALYAYLAKKIGEICLDGIQYILISTCIPKKVFLKFRLFIMLIIILILYSLMSLLIAVTATDEGFGNGIYTYGTAVYFLFTTTFTIGFGDVMMSGSNTPLTLCIALWLSSTFGITLCIIQEISDSLKGTFKASIDLDLDHVEQQRLSRISVIESKIWTKTCLIDTEPVDSDEQLDLNVGKRILGSDKNLQLVEKDRPQIHPHSSPIVEHGDLLILSDKDAIEVDSNIILESNIIPNRMKT